MRARLTTLCFGLSIVGVLVLPASSAWAGWGLRNSVGDSFYLVKPDKDSPQKGAQTSGNGSCKYFCYGGDVRRPGDLEIMPYYSFGLVSIDLAMVAQLEAQNDVGYAIGFRPGIRIFPLLGLFGRLSFPLTSANLGYNNSFFAYNLSVGAGYQLKLGPWGIFGEIDVNPALQTPFSLPIEFRAGLALEN